MKLELKNPLIFFDLETTGIDIVNDRIVQIAYHKVYPNGKEESKSFLINPGIPIPAQATAIHNITNDDVAMAPLFKHVANEIARDFEGCDLAGYNSNRFDIPLLAEELLRAEVDIDLSKRKFIDVQVVFHKKEPRNLSAAYQFYCNKELTGAHDATVDTMATYEILKAQLELYQDLPATVEGLSKYTTQSNNVDFAGRFIYDENGHEVFNFGKYKGQKVSDILKKDTGYFGWMLSGDFSLHTKKVLMNIKLREMSK
ncbi:MAG: 3'-5' exonuclease [Bacteroidales bacterium]|jgi:DNA polymerase-3 subunit epsilon|nr:3'-5' exonuclease [Bacteroidales bacterium]HOS45244.1 3'-5' exonuclease [Paludibacter sp.]